MVMVLVGHLSSGCSCMNSFIWCLIHSLVDSKPVMLCMSMCIEGVCLSACTALAMVPMELP